VSTAAIALIVTGPGGPEDVLDLRRVTAEQRRDHMVGQVRRDRQLAAVQGCIADTMYALVGFYFERDEIAAWRADDDAAVGDLHRRRSAKSRKWAASAASVRHLRFELRCP
jgi:hypothetical protein